MFQPDPASTLDQVIAALHDRSTLAYYALSVVRQTDGSYACSVLAMPGTGTHYARSPLTSIPADSVFAESPLSALAHAFSETINADRDDPVLG